MSSKTKSEQDFRSQAELAFKKIQPSLYKATACLCVLLSLYVIICELLIMVQFETPLIYNSNMPMVSSVLAYLTFTTYYGLFNIRIFSLYNLDSSGHTDSFSLLYSARTLTGLASPLCFNFLKLTNVQNTQFHQVLNPLDAIPVLGRSFQTFFPGVLFLLCLVNYFDVWTKIVKSVGLEELAFTDVFDESRVENGRKLVKIERSTRHRQLGVTSFNHTLNFQSSDGEDNDESTTLL